jgi:hypothetical protein
MLDEYTYAVDESMYEIVSKGGLEMVVEAMKRFTTNAPLQAAGCWLFGVISNKSSTFD